jgi:hypothetical protein
MKKKGIWIDSNLTGRGLSPLDKLLYSQIVYYSKDGGFCIKSNIELSLELEISESSVKRSLELLQEIGLLKRDTDRKMGNVRRITPLVQNEPTPTVKMTLPLVQNEPTPTVKMTLPLVQNEPTYIGRTINKQLKEQSINNTNSDFQIFENLDSVKNENLEGVFLKMILLKSDNEIEEQMKLIIKNKVSESNIQAEFFCKCREVGLNCYLEYTYENCRFDAVLYDDEKNIYCIVEFKSYKTDKAEKLNTKQLCRYKKYNLPIIVCTRLDDVKGAIIQSLRQFYIVCDDDKKKEVEIIANDFIAKSSAKKEKETNYPFEIIWGMYGKKGSSKVAKQRYEKLSEAKRAIAFDHVPKYVASTPQIQYRKNFEVYINQESFNDQIIKQNANSTNSTSRNFKNESGDQYLARVGSELDAIFELKFGRGSHESAHAVPNESDGYTSFTEF